MRREGSNAGRQHPTSNIQHPTSNTQRPRPGGSLARDVLAASGVVASVLGRIFQIQAARAAEDGGYYTKASSPGARATSNALYFPVFALRSPV